MSFVNNDIAPSSFLPEIRPQHEDGSLTGEVSHEFAGLGRRPGQPDGAKVWSQWTRHGAPGPKPTLDTDGPRLVSARRFRSPSAAARLPGPRTLSWEESRDGSSKRPD